MHGDCMHVSMIHIAILAQDVCRVLVVIVP